MALPTNKNNIPFKSVVDQVLQRDGVDTQLVGLATDLVAYINDRLKQAWHHEFWPQTVRVEKRHYHQVFCAGQEYEIGDILFSNGSYYVCVSDTQTDPSFTTVELVDDDGDPATPMVQETILNPNWSIIEDYPKLVPYWQNGDDILADGKEYMHRIFSVSMRNPHRTANPGYLNFELLHDGVIVSDLAPAEIFIKYQVEPQVYTLEPLQENRVYIPDIPFGDLARKSDIVYDNVTGHCYKPLQNATEQDPFTDREFWERVPFPSFLERYVVHGAYADWLASEGQLDKSKNEDAYASKILEDLMDMYAPQDQVNTQVKFSRLG